MPPILPGTVDGIIGPKSNIQNRASFKLKILSSIPFVVDPFSVFPTTVYNDFSGNISVKMTGVPPQIFLSSFDLLIGSFSVPREQMYPIAGASRSTPSLLLFSILGFNSGSLPMESVCTLQFNGASQFFNITVLPTIPITSVSSVSPTLGSSLGGAVISLTASLFREMVPTQKPRFYVDNNEVTSTVNISGSGIVSDKFSTSVSFIAPQMTEGRRQITIAHPAYLGSNVTFSFVATLPARRVEPLFSNIRRNVNVTLKVLVTNFLDVSSIDIFTNSAADYDAVTTKALIISSVSISRSVSLVTMLLPASISRPIKSQASWIVRDGTAGNATFALTIDADAISLASATPTSVSAYGGNQLNFIVTSFSYDVASRDWTCSFPFSNVSAQSVSRMDSSTVSVQCIAPPYIQAMTASQTVSCALLYQQHLVSNSLPFSLTFSAPPPPSLFFSDGKAEIFADSASVFVRDFVPFNSIDVLRVFIGSFRLTIRNFAVRNGLLQLQFSVSCSDCQCCSGESSILTVSHNQFPMMSSRIQVVVIDPNSPAVVSVNPSIIPASSGTIVEIQVKNFPSTSAVTTVSVGNAASAVAFQVLSEAGSTTTSVRFYSPALPSGSLGYAIRVGDSSSPLVTVAPSTSLALSVSDIIISGQCSLGSLPAFGSITVKCIVNNLPIPSAKGQLEFRYILSNSTVLVSSKNAEFLQTSDTTLSIDLMLPNCADRVFQSLSIRLQILNINFRSLTFFTAFGLVI